INIVTGNSMYPTLEEKQILFSDSADKIHRLDIVTAYFPKRMTTLDGLLIVKRVIGMPGDNLLIDATGVYINGEKIEEDYLTEEAKRNTYTNNEEICIVLGEDEYFLMGDNRETSYDSRKFGVLTKDRICFRQQETPTKQFWIKIGMFMGLTVFGGIMYIVMSDVLLILYILYRRKHSRSVYNNK
ncbi:MAG: signal peptidase I, partial [Lachnospiraceae bacterium]|nr:signal peptidase I [Lachnospiraceae bacterium]